MLLRQCSLRECPEQIHGFFLHFCRIVHQRCASHLCLWDSLLKCFAGLFLQVFVFCFSFFSGVLFFSWGESQLEKLASCSSQNISVSRRECSRDCKQWLWGGGGRRMDLLIHFASTWLSLTLQLLWHLCATQAPSLHSPPMLPHPPLSTICYPEPLYLASSRTMWELLLLFDRWTWKRKRQNIVVVVIWARIQMLRGISLPNQWTNKQTNNLSLSLFFLFWLRKNISFSLKWKKIPFHFQYASQWMTAGRHCFIQ